MNFEGFRRVPGRGARRSGRGGGLRREERDVQAGEEGYGERSATFRPGRRVTGRGARRSGRGGDVPAGERDVQAGHLRYRISSGRLHDP